MQARLSLHLSKCHIVEMTCHGSYAFVPEVCFYLKGTATLVASES